MKIVKLLLALILPVLLTGCEQIDRLVWSPDGKQLAVVSSDGLRIGDATGVLSKSLLADVGMVRWLPDSTSMLVVHSTSTTSWKEVSQLLSAKERNKAIADAEWLWRFPGDLNKSSNFTGRDLANAILYLNYRYGVKAVKAWLTRKHQNIAEGMKLSTKTIHTLQSVKFLHDKTETGRILLRTTNEISDVRLAAKGKLVAITEDTGSSGARLEVMPIENGEKQVIAEAVCGRPDWSIDGRALFYMQGSGPSAASSETNLSMASIMRREIADYDGKLLPKFGAALSLVKIPKSPGTRIRSLPDGAIIFNSDVVDLPCTTDKFGSGASLFKLSRDYKSLAPIIAVGDALGDNLENYQINQDGTRAAVPGRHGEITVMELATGKVKSLEPKSNDLKFSPDWRTADDLCYPSKAANGRDMEVVLQSLSDSHPRSVLSKDWPQSASAFLKEPAKKEPAKQPRRK